MIETEALFKISYGLYVVCSGDRTGGNGFISNTVFQVTSDPPKFAASCNKDNFTAEFIRKAGAFSVSVLGEYASPELIGRFGYRSGRDSDKLAGINVNYGVTGVPIVLDGSLAHFEFRVIETIDAGTHWLFIGLLVAAEIFDTTSDPMTYKYYRDIRKGIAPKNAPTYIDKSKSEEALIGKTMKKFKCLVCGYIYNENIESVKFDELPDNWTCPNCGADKSYFIEI